MSTANAAQLDPALLEPVEPILSKHFEENRTVTKRIATSDKKMNTRGIRVPVYIRPATSFAWFPEGGSHAPPDAPTYIETKVYPVRCSVGYDFTGTWLRMVGDSNSLVKGITSYFSQIQASGLKKWEQAFCATYTGELAVVVSRDSSTQVTVSTTFANGSTWSNRKLHPKTRVAWYSSAGAQRTGSGTLSIVSESTVPVPSTGVTTFDAVPTDVVATDIAVFGDPTTAGSYTRALNGLQDFVSASGVIQGQSRTTYRELQSLVDNAGGAAITSTRLRKNKSAMRFRAEGAMPNFPILSSVAQYDMFERQFLNRIRFVGGETAKDSVKAMFDEHEWETSVDIHDDRIYLDPCSDIKWYPMKEWGRYNEDGQDWRMNFSNGTGADKFTGWFGSEGNFGCSQFRKKCVITNLSTPTDVAAGYLSV